METKNNNKLGTQIFKQGDFTLKHVKYCDEYSLLYKDTLIWDGELYELFFDEFRFYIFEIEHDPNKAASFIVELYKWGEALQEAIEKMFDEYYDEK